MASSDADKRAAREALEHLGIKSSQDLPSAEEYANIIHAPDNGSTDLEAATDEDGNDLPDNADDEDDIAAKPALEPGQPVPAGYSAMSQVAPTVVQPRAPAQAARSPQSASVAAPVAAPVVPTQGVPASIAAPASEPQADLSGNLPSGGPAINPLEQAPAQAQESPEEKYKALVAKYTQANANQDYASGAGAKSPEEAAANWQKYTRMAESQAVDELAKQHDHATAQADYEAKAGNSAEDKKYQQDLGAYKQQMSAVTAENAKRAKIGLPLLPVPEAPVAPDHGPIADETHPAVEQIAEAAAIPQAADVHEAAHEILQPVRQERAQQLVAQQAQQEIAGFQAADQKRMDDAQKQLDDLQAKSTNEVRSGTLHEMLTTGNLSSKLGAAIAVMLGGVSQGLTGAKTNPVMDYINTAVDQQAQKDKLTQEKKEGLRKLLIEQATLKIHALTQQTDNTYKQGELRNKAAQLDILRDKADKAQTAEIQKELLRRKANEVFNSVSAPVATATPQIAQENSDFDAAMDATRELDPKKYDRVADAVIVLPNGKKVVATAPKKRVQYFETNVRPKLETARAGLKDLEEFSKNASWYNPRDQAILRSKLNVVASQVGVELGGTGNMTEDEFNRNLKTIGNPLGITNISNWEYGKLHSVIGSIDTQLHNQARAIGVNWPLTARQQAEQQLKASGKYTQQQIDAALDKQGL